MGFSPEKAYPYVRWISILLVLLSALFAGLHTVANTDESRDESRVHNKPKTAHIDQSR